MILYSFQHEQSGTRVQLVTGPIVQTMQDHILVVSLLTETEFQCQASIVEKAGILFFLQSEKFQYIAKKILTSSIVEKLEHFSSCHPKSSNMQQRKLYIKTRTFLSASSEKFQNTVNPNFLKLEHCYFSIQRPKLPE